MEWLTDFNIWSSLITLTILEIVLGIDNLVFISILADKLPAHQQAKGRHIGLSLALITRVLLLCFIFALTKLTTPLFTILGHGFSGKDLIMLVGGLFLIAKATHEIHEKLEGDEEHTTKKAAAKLGSVIIQIVLIDIVFSLDSVITAVGLANQIAVMIVAVVLAMIVMLIASGKISAFINRHPSIKMLALSFLLLIGVVLVAEGFHQEVPKGYIYFAMAFSVLVEVLNIRVSRKKHAKPVALHHTPHREA